MMHFCALPQPESSTVAALLAVSDDGQTCASLGAVDIVLPTVLIPPLSLADGAIVGAAICTCWLAGAAISRAKSLFKNF